MDVTYKIHTKLRKILTKLKNLGIVQTFKLEINFCQMEGSMRNTLIEIDSVLKKCLRRIINKPRKAEIRNVISELVRKKNLSNIVIAKEPIQKDILDKKSVFINHATSDITALELKFQCGFCQEIFNSKKNFVIHKKIHKNSAKYLCDKCGQFCDSVQMWQEHLKEYHEPDVLPFTLRNFSSDLENEMLIFENCNLNMVPENQMQNVVNLESLLIETVDERELKTSVCSSHLESCGSEKVEKKFVCSCGKVFHILKTLRKHERLKHSNKNVKYNCVTCGKSFIEKGKLNRHMLSHRDSQYTCSFCSKQFARSDTLKRHMTIFHYTSKEFYCSFCQKRFKLKFNRDAHEENIHKNVNDQVQCQHCGRKFKNKVTLKSHMKIHLEKKITCTTCCKSFSRNSYYKSHLKRKHFGAIPHQKVLETVCPTTV